MPDTVQRAELAEFLRAKREATDPVSVGLIPGGRRRTPGLRREELAQLAGVSVTWYTWLEQARDITVSRQVLESLVRELRLTPAERAHVFTLAGMALPVEVPHPHTVDSLLSRLVHDFMPKPAYVANPWWDILVANEAYSTLLGGLNHRPPPERNILWITVTESRRTGLFVDWATEARSLAGQLRVNLAQHPDDPRGPQLLRSVLEADDTFRQMWDEHTVAQFESSRKRLRHPGVGRLNLDYLKFAPANDEQLSLILFLPADEATARKLTELG